jgi:hypothetical protein
MRIASEAKMNPIEEPLAKEAQTELLPVRLTPT